MIVSLSRLAIALGALSVVSCATRESAPELVVEPTFLPRTFTTIGKNVHVMSEPLKVSFKELPSIVVPAGFITDLASIPKPLQSIESKTGPSMAPAILHDYLYWYQPCTKDEADAVFYVAMLSMDVGRVVTPAIFQAVSDFGSAYDDNRARRRFGEKRTFTSDYVQEVKQLPFVASTPLEAIQSRAKGRFGFVDKEIAPSSVKETCKAILDLCVTCKEYLSKKGEKA